MLLKFHLSKGTKAMRRLFEICVPAYLLYATMLTAAGQTGPVALMSPNGAIVISLATVRGRAVETAGGQLAYRVDFRGKPVIQWSNLGLAIDDAPALGPVVRIESSQLYSQDETWKSVQGKANPIRNHFNAVTVQTAETTTSGRRLALEARAYDDGVAFRYVVPEQPNLKELRILNESTQFNFVKDAQIWPLILRGFQTSSEGDYRQTTISGLRPENLVYLPLLMQVPETAWVGLTEADLEDYSNLYVTAAGGQSLTARLAPRVENINTSADVAPAFDPKADALKVSVIAPLPVKSAWRVLMIADDPGRLVESNMVVNLNPPCALADTSWIKPGKTSWDWWNGSQETNVKNPGENNGKNNDTVKYCIDFCARNKFEYMIVDGGWSKVLPKQPGQVGYSFRGPMDLTQSVPTIDIPMLVEYAKSKNVLLWVWAHFRDVNDQMDTAFAQFEKWGVVGVKIDFLDRSDQWMVSFYRTVAQKAAAHHLMVNFHGAFKPDGMERTYPNVLTREAVMGVEYNRWSSRVTPPHDVALAFTRMLAGPMDYTPGGFDNVLQKDFKPRAATLSVMGTRAHQTALFVVFESALQIVADSPAAYDGQKETEFLKAVPASWDETRVINGVPAKYITMARRRGDEWFVGSITDWDARDLDVPLSFLGNTAYDAEIYSDGPNAAAQPKDSMFEKRRVNAQTVLKLKLAPGGGSALHLVPVR
jgi:alpha-glucosidase